MNISVKIKNLTKSFSISKFDLNRKYKIENIKILDDISYNFKSGTVTGILGGNGSGKSTLLRLISGIYLPSDGEINVYGQVYPIIGVSAGFQDELSVMDNIEIQSCLLGISSSEINKKKDEILKFSELEDYVDAPVRVLSSGMRNKLGFSIFTSYEPEILILDEVFSVGDSRFKEKSFDRLKNLLSKKKVTAIVTSHDNSVIKKICNSALILNKSKIKVSGSIDTVLEAYSRIDL